MTQRDIHGLLVSASSACREAVERIEMMEQEIRILRNALAPLARFAKSRDLDRPRLEDDYKIVSHSGKVLTMGNMRKAREMYEHRAPYETEPIEGMD